MVRREALRRRRLSEPANIDAYTRRVVGWRVSRSSHAIVVPDALERAFA